MKSPVGISLQCLYDQSVCIAKIPDVSKEVKGIFCPTEKHRHTDQAIVNVQEGNEGQNGKERRVRGFIWPSLVPLLLCLSGCISPKRYGMVRGVVGGVFGWFWLAKIFD